MDLYAKPNTQALAITDGTVVDITWMTGYGVVLLLEFQFQKRTLYALYAHLTKAIVDQGETKEGTPVALTGVSGNATGEPPHLHFEIWDKRHANQYPFPEGRISPGAVLGYHFDNMDNRMPLRDIG